MLKAYPYITLELFYKWNPALEGNCEGLWANYWYCVANYDQANLPQPPSQPTPGTPVGDGTVSGCKAWYQTTGGDDCDIISQAFGSFSTSDFISWNPSVGSRCDGIKVCRIFETHANDGRFSHSSEKFFRGASANKM